MHDPEDAEALKPEETGAASGKPRNYVSSVEASSHDHGFLGRFLAFLGVVALYGADQATKLWTVANLSLGEQRVVIDQFFHWVHFSNTGAAFGILQDSNRFFIGLSIVALIALAIALARRIFPGVLNRIAMLLLVSGVLGNLTDRILHGYVVDFLFFDLGFPPANPWPAFNVADSCICVAVVLMLLASLQEEFARRASANSAHKG